LNAKHLNWHSNVNFINNDGDVERLLRSLNRIQSRKLRMIYSATSASTLGMALRHLPWEFEKGKQLLSVAVNGPLVVDDVEIVIRAVLDGIGLAFVSDERVVPQLKSGKLIRVLEDWCQPFPGFFLSTRAVGSSQPHFLL
jgi:DNA-binding transcriptional LysR family regulator